MRPFQPDLPLEALPTGYDSWQGELHDRTRALEERFGVFLSVPVRLQLRDFHKPFEGVVEPVVGTDHAPRFRIRGERFDFGPDEIESCHRLDRAS